MALDGLVTSAKRCAEGVRITLGPREAETYISQEGELAQGYESIPGQTSMLIVGATFEPHVGDQVWGGSRSVRIESGGISFPYVREGYTKMREDWPRAAHPATPAPTVPAAAGGGAAAVTGEAGV